MSVRDKPPAPGASPTGANEGLFGVLQAFVRSPQYLAALREQLGRGVIGSAVASPAQRSGIDIAALNRGMLGPLYGQSAGNYSVTSAAPAWAEVDSTRLAGTLYCSGRPVRIDISAGITKGTMSSIQVSVAMDGVEVTGISDGMMWSDQAGDNFVCGWHVMTPAPGLHRFAMVADVVVAGGAGALIYSGGGFDITQMLVTEL